MSEFHFDRTQVRRNFGRAAGTYEKHDALQREVQSTLVEHVAHTDRMFIQVDDYLLAHDLAKVGDKVVVISGSPPGIIGSTNDIRIHKVGDAVHGKAPIYKSGEL